MHPHSPHVTRTTHAPVPRRQDQRGAHERGCAVFPVWKFELARRAARPPVGVRKRPAVDPPVGIQLAAPVCVRVTFEVFRAMDPGFGRRVHIPRAAAASWASDADALDARTAATAATAAARDCIVDHCRGRRCRWAGLCGDAMSVRCACLLLAAACSGWPTTTTTNR